MVHKGPPDCTPQDGHTASIRHWIGAAIANGPNPDDIPALLLSAADAEDVVDVLWEHINSAIDVGWSKQDMCVLLEKTCMAHTILPRRFYLHQVTGNADRASLVSGRVTPSHSSERIHFLSMEAWDKTPVAVIHFEKFQVGQRSGDFPTSSVNVAAHQAFCLIALRWSKLKHKNVQEFLGVVEHSMTNYLDAGQSQTLCMVTPWMSRGNITDVLDKLIDDPAFDGEAGAIHKWIKEIAVGLKYLHDQGICHSELHPGNILIDDEGSVRLADFGFHWICEALMGAGLRSHVIGAYPARYLAPEKHDPESFGLGFYPDPTFAHDIYAYACVCYELYAHKAPFGEQTHFKAAKYLLEGRRPAKPVSTDGPGSYDMPDLLWLVVTRCWAQEAVNRPSIQVVVDELLADSIPTA